VASFTPQTLYPTQRASRRSIALEVEGARDRPAAALTLPGTEPPLLCLVRSPVTTVSYVSWHTLHYRVLEMHSSFCGISRGH